MMRGPGGGESEPPPPRELISSMSKHTSGKEGRRHSEASSAAFEDGEDGSHTAKPRRIRWSVYTSTLWKLECIRMFFDLFYVVS